MTRNALFMAAVVLMAATLIEVKPAGEAMRLGSMAGAREYLDHTQQHAEVNKLMRTAAGDEKPISTNSQGEDGKIMRRMARESTYSYEQIRFLSNNIGPRLRNRYPCGVVADALIECGTNRGSR